MDVDDTGELLTRLIKYPAETRSDNKIKAAARASLHNPHDYVSCLLGTNPGC